MLSDPLWPTVLRLVFQKSRLGARRRRSATRFVVERLEERVVLDSGGISVPKTDLTYAGGPLIANVQVEPIYLQDDLTGKETSAQLQSEFQSFFQTITTDSYIPALSSQYSVKGYSIGTGSVGTADADVQVTPGKPDYSGTSGAVTDGQVQRLILQEIADGNTAAPTANTLYYVFTPPGDAATDTGDEITEKKGSTDNQDDSVTGFNGFHSYFVDPTTHKNIYYAVIPDKGPPNGDLSGSDLFQAETRTSSHELAEAITDPVPGSGWTVSDLKSSQIGSEIGDLAAHEAYELDGYTVQYEWSNLLQSPANALGTGPNNLFINQLTPPSIKETQSVPVATFSTSNTSLTAQDFAVTVDTIDSANLVTGAGNGDLGWSNIMVAGSNGHFVVNATPPDTGKLLNFGKPFSDEGLSVSVTNLNPLPGDGGDPVTSRYVPYKLAANKGTLNYTSDYVGSNSLTLRYNSGTGNLELTDNGLLVYSQPLVMTDAINIKAEPGSYNTLTINLGASWPAGTSLPKVTFDGGSTGTPTLQIAGNLPGKIFSNIVDTNTGANAANVDLATKGSGRVQIDFTHVATLNITSVATNVTVKVPNANYTKVQNGKTITLTSPTHRFAKTSFVAPAGTLEIRKV